MASDVSLSLYVFGAGTGESILLTIEPAGESPRIFIIDSYATKPYDSPDNNPIIGIQPKVFEWEEVEAICLTHAHEDHFMGLESVASRTTNAKWVWPGGIPIDSVVRHYDVLADYKEPPTGKHKHKKWVVDSIRSLAEWSKSQKPSLVICGKKLLDSPISIKCLAPTDITFTEYTRKLMKNFGNIAIGDDQNPPDDFHNVPSAGLIFDTMSGTRVMLLGDMVEESWKSIFDDPQLMKLLKERKVDILKLPHHCSNGAVFKKLLELICDPVKTKAVLTPFRKKKPPPHDEAIKLVSNYVDELWCTVTLEREDDIWKSGSNNLQASRLLQSSFPRSPRKGSLPPVDCMVAFEVEASGAINISPGKYAHCLKGPAYTAVPAT